MQSKRIRKNKMFLNIFWMGLFFFMNFLQLGTTSKDDDGKITKLTHKKCKTWEHGCVINNARGDMNTNVICLSPDKICNGIMDCVDGSDESSSCTPCNKTYVGETGKKYSLEIKRPSENQLPFLCSINITAMGKAMGELVQINFESFSVGKFESFTYDGCPDGFLSIDELTRPSTNGKWCGSSWGYTVYYSETHSLLLNLNLKKFSEESAVNYGFEFKISYKFLPLSEAKIRYGKANYLERSKNFQSTGTRSYRGKLHLNTYCDRLLEGCSKKQCRIQSPNYPGIYQRNLTCNFKIRERVALKGKHALIAVRQSQSGQSVNHGNGNSNKVNQENEKLTKFDSSETQIGIWDKCNFVQDYIEILDGTSKNAPLLAHLCVGEAIPEVISSSSEMIIKFHTSPYGNPFHPLPLSALPGFELEVQVYYVDKESPTYIEHGKKCEFIINRYDQQSGFLESPLHSLPPNTTCHYRFKGHKRQEVVWISFIKYHVPPEILHFSDISGENCDVKLQIWDGDTINDSKAEEGHRKSVSLLGQFCRDEKPKLCDHSLLSNSSRNTRPCTLSESYISSGPDLTIINSIKQGNVLFPVNFMLRYEFVDFSQEGTQKSLNPCDRIFKSQNGKFNSPKITFLYGRGGQRYLKCTYTFEFQSKSQQQYIKFTFLRASFGNRNCSSVYDAKTRKYSCRYRENDDDAASITISEYPWKDVEIERGCLCENISRPLKISTTTANKVVVNFAIENMEVHDDYNNYFFDASYELVRDETSKNFCSNIWNNKRLKGTSGEIVISNGEESENNVTFNNKIQLKFKLNQSYLVYNYFNACRLQPWLIEPEDSLTNFIYLKAKGKEIFNDNNCSSKNRILIYTVGSNERTRIVCPEKSSDESNNTVEIFSEGWEMFSYKNVQLKHTRSFVIEFLQREVGNFHLSWLEVSKNPALVIPGALTVIKPPECMFSCPEIEACISSELWCDGFQHCPSGSDEKEMSCHSKRKMSKILMNTALVFIIILIFLLIGCSTSIYFWRRQRRKEHQRSMVVTWLYVVILLS